MPPTRDDHNRHAYGRSMSNSGVALSAKVYHQATNLTPALPSPQSPGAAPTFPPPRSSSTSTWSRQNSSNGKYS